MTFFKNIIPDMTFFRKTILVGIIMTLLSVSASAHNPKFHIYLCIGQSNMEGSAPVEPTDRQGVSERFKVMATVDFSSPTRTKGEWYTAVPPLVRQNAGLTLMDNFGRTMIDNLPKDVIVGVVPVAVGGCKIEHLSKDFDPSSIASEPDWFKALMKEYDNRPYDRLIECARKAKEEGVIKGILLHQGESNNGDPKWCEKVKKVYEDILADLNLSPESVPLLAGEVVTTEQGGICGAMNAIIGSLPTVLPTARVISAANLPQKGDGLHFTAHGYRVLGSRYATEMLSLMDSTPYARPVVEFVTPTIVRVRWTPDGSLTDNATGVCVYKATPVEVTTEEADGRTIMQSEALKVSIGADGHVVFTDPETSDVLLSESAQSPRRWKRVMQEKIIYDDSSARMEETANGKVTVKDVLRRDTLGVKNRAAITFCMKPDEGIYGLGSHMEDYMNLLGKKLYLTQHNLKAFVPMLLSTRGYGLLFDAGCSMKYESRPTTGGSYETTMEMESVNTLDYYFIKGASPEKVVAGYRYLTGAVGMMPRYLFGYIQSKERYVSSEDIVNTVKEYRRRHVPLDMIVQDWNYWPQGWGYMKMNPKYYPDPKALADSVHALNAKLMVSIWANPQRCPQEEDFRKRGFMLEHSVYDAFNPAARDLYWEYANREFFSNGFDAWWCDSSEPLDGDWNRMPEPENGRKYSWDDHERRWQLNDAILSEALGADRACLYSLNHAKGIYEHQRSVSDEKRVVNLTRSTFAGQQRYATVVWNGDTHASWASFRQQIPAGLNYMATGNPYWTVDVGCFFTRKDPRWFYQGEFPQGVADDGYKEFYTRMFQWATFLPVLRSHGTDTPREIWQFGEAGTPYYDAILKMIHCRYKLMPYIYSMAAAQNKGSYTMARPLAFDFPKDSKVFDLKDQYMFGDIMVCPVTHPGAQSREVYLPETAGGWVDFWTGTRLDGGQTIVADAPLERLPVYAKGGSILLTTEVAEHSGATVGNPVTAHVFTGRDAAFTLYDDAGDGYAFEKGESTQIRFLWDDRRQRLTISESCGTYPGAPAKRVFYVRVAGKEKKVDYTGKKKVVRF